MNLLLARCVPYTFNDRCLAIHDYVRTEDVRHLVGPIYEHANQHRHHLTCGVAWWMWNAHRNGTLKYIPDPEDCDFWARPLVTLARRGGDCDDLAILAGTLGRAVGLYTEFVVGRLTQKGVPPGVHVWVEGSDEYGFFLIEATRGTLLRERPRGYEPFYFLTPERCFYPGERHATRAC